MKRGALLVVLVAAAGCYLPDAVDGLDLPPPNGPGPGGGTTGGTATALPCDVDALLTRSCRGCHGAQPSAPMALVTREHLLAAAPSSPSQSVGALSVARMADAARPMPPGGLLPAEERAVLASWVQAGMPAGDCGASMPPQPEPAQCTSGTYYSPSSEEGPHMNPGLACVSCHLREDDGPTGVGGTVYPTRHEPDLCNGVPGNMTVVLTGADGRELRLPVNAQGNFFATQRTFAGLALPFRARVEGNGRVRMMSTPQTSGDCNACHTQRGANGAPGRVLAP